MQGFIPGKRQWLEQTAEEVAVVGGREEGTALG